MKNQYFGDVNDYRKYGLLRALVGDSDLDVAFGWMLTPDDGGTDGGFRSYLDRPREWRHFDSELYEWLAASLRHGAAPGVALLEGAGLFPHARFIPEFVPDGRALRERWAECLVASATDADLVFLDPDNGLQVASKPAGSKDSSKYAQWAEVEALWRAGSSVLIYQHFRREKRDEFAQRMMRELRDRTGAPLVEAFRTPHVLFLLAGQERHRALLEVGVRERLVVWRGQIDPIALEAAQS